MLLSSNFPAPGQLSIWALLRTVPAAVYIDQWLAQDVPVIVTAAAWWTADLVIQEPCVLLWTLVQRSVHGLPLHGEPPN
jgi:hypothetical protein